MKHYNPLAWMMATAIAGMTMTACSLDRYESENPILIIDPVEETMLAACGVSVSDPRPASDGPLLFTDRDIQWFNVTTREIKFRDMDEPLHKRLEPYREIRFYFGGDVLFVVSSFVSDFHSMIFTDLVLHYDVITDPGQGHYYLHDCYPLQFIDTDEVKANIKKRAGQWELFTNYLRSKGKLRK